MIRPKALHVRAFRGSRQPVVVASEAAMMLLVGANGQGKSSLLQAMEWCLFGGEIARAGCGIAERKGWQVGHRPRGEDPLDPEVTLVLAGPGGELRVRRCRQGSGRQREALAVETPGGRCFEDGEAVEHLRGLGLPDWSTWSRAFCHHQERPRGRLLDPNERSAVIGRLLGLEPWAALRAVFEGARTSELLRHVDEVVAGTGDAVVSDPDAAAREVARHEERLVAMGIPARDIGPGLSRKVRQRMLVRAGEVADVLGLGRDEDLPGDVEGGAFERWMHDWPVRIRRRASSASRSDSVGRQRAALADALARCEETARAARPARERRRGLEQEHGGLEELDRQLGDLREQRERAAERLGRENALVDLLRRARAVVAERMDDQCPVCASPAAGLRERLAAAETGELEERVAVLVAEGEQLERRQRALVRQRQELDEALGAEHRAVERHERARTDLRAALGEARGAGGSVEDEARAAVARLDRRIDELSELHERLEGALGEHRRDLGILEEVDRWRAARQRVRRAGGDGEGPERRDFEQALDEAAGCAVDLRALAGLARDAEAAHGEHRIEEVNRTLAGHFATIMGEATVPGLRVVVDRKPRGLTYELVGGDGRPVLPELNQSALDALSLAMLFAQARARAAEGLPCWLVLDDPAQGMDHPRAGGLARALHDMAGIVPVWVATTPGEFAEMLADGPCPVGRRDLRPWSPERGLALEGEA